MIRYINYVLTAILVMLVLPFAPFLAIAVIPIAFIYHLVEPREKIWQEFSFRRMIRNVGFKPPKKALACYVFWLYVHLVFLGAFSSGIFNPTNFANFWPFHGDFRVYDITEFMVFTGPPLFLILIYGLSRNEVREEEVAFSDGMGHHAYQSISPIVVEPATPEIQISPAMPIVEAVMEDETRVVDQVALEVPPVEAPVYSPTTNQELLELIQQQQRHMEMLDAELQNLKLKMESSLRQKA